MAIADKLAQHGLPPPQALQDRPQLDADEAYLARMFSILHRTRGRTLDGPEPITLRDISALLEFWPQFDALGFAETMLTIDQTLLQNGAEQRQAEREKQERKAPHGK